MKIYISLFKEHSVLKSHFTIFAKRDAKFKNTRNNRSKKTQVKLMCFSKKKKKILEIVFLYFYFLLFLRRDSSSFQLCPEFVPYTVFYTSTGT